MSNIKIKGGKSLEQLLASAGEELEATAILATKKAAHNAGLKTERVLKAGGNGARRVKGKKYNRSWKMRTNETGIILFNDAQAGLTWLLENGHDIVRNGEKIGHFDGIPHIKPAQDYGAELFEEGIIEEMSRRLGA